MARELTREDLDRYLGEIDYTYHDGYEPTGFPIDYGCEEYWQAINSVLNDVIGRISRRYGLDKEN